LAGSVTKSTQPEGQLLPLGHAQTPLLHVAPGPQRTAQLPQWFSSLVTSKQPSAHIVPPPGHLHTPALQLSAPSQGEKQPPQCSSSVARSTQSTGEPTPGTG
jgi:hypothetical protein